MAHGGKREHSGRKVGSKNEKTEQWDQLNESIVGQQAENYNNFLNELWAGDPKSKALAADFYLRTIEYFKPKRKAIEQSFSDDTIDEIRRTIISKSV